MIFDFGGGYHLRLAREDDHAALNHVCLVTGDAGKDATAREDDPDLLGLIYAVPYQVLEPALAAVIEGPDGVAGYVLGALNTVAFNRRLEAQWYPRLMARVRDPGEDRAQWRGSDPLRHMVHHEDFSVPASLAPYPSHGHIDLLPETRGRGIGRRAMRWLESELAARGSAGLHLVLDRRNEGALAFYRAIGFELLDAPDPVPGALTVVKRLL